MYNWVRADFCELECPVGKFSQGERGSCREPVQGPSGVLGEKGMWSRVETTSFTPHLYLGLTLLYVQLRNWGNSFIY